MINRLSLDIFVKILFLLPLSPQPRWKSFLLLTQHFFARWRFEQPDSLIYARRSHVYNVIVFSSVETLKSLVKNKFRFHFFVVDFVEGK